MSAGVSRSARVKWCGPPKNRGEFACKKCKDKKFDNIDLLRSHDDVFHLRRQCQICGLILEGNIRYNRHLRLAHPEREEKFTCDICNKTLKSGTRLLSHNRSFHTNFECRLCGQIDTGTKMHRHLLRHHNRVSMETYAFPIQQSDDISERTCKENSRLTEFKRVMRNGLIQWEKVNIWPGQTKDSPKKVGQKQEKNVVIQIVKPELRQLIPTTRKNILNSLFSETKCFLCKEYHSEMTEDLLPEIDFDHKFEGLNTEFTVDDNVLALEAELAADPIFPLTANPRCSNCDSSFPSKLSELMHFCANECNIESKVLTLAANAQHDWQNKLWF